ncbi:hypothetical protein JCM17380_55150 [Desulfosporosinus burensis]
MGILRGTYTMGNNPDNLKESLEACNLRHSRDSSNITRCDCVTFRGKLILAGTAPGGHRSGRVPGTYIWSTLISFGGLSSNGIY